MKDVEIEIQVKVENIEPLMNFLEKNGKLVGKKREIDEYYTPIHRNFAGKKPIDEWLRLRNSEGKYSFTYKNWHREIDGKTHHCDEYEIQTSDNNTLKKILNVLDFKPVVKVDKTREKYIYNDYEIVIDDVAGLGVSVEIEFKTETEEEPAKITEEMINFLRNLGVGKIKRSFQGHAFILLHPEDEKYEVVN